MLTKVTFTGVDDKTDIKRLCEIQKKYPFAEFGVLISVNNTGKHTNNRYPDFTIFKKLKGRGLNLSLHVCGSLARNIASNNDWQALKDFVGKDFDIFSRVQLNLKGSHKFADSLSLPDSEKQVIIQICDSSFDYYDRNKGSRIMGLFDNSGGTGVVAKSYWTDLDASFIGYAGGISEENVLEIIKNIDSTRVPLPHYYEYWIDMESSLRDNKDRFDLDVVERICEKVLPLLY